MHSTFFFFLPIKYETKYMYYIQNVHVSLFYMQYNFHTYHHKACSFQLIKNKIPCFISPPCLACQTYCDTGHPLTPIAERVPVELSLPFFTTKVCRGWDSNSQPSACESNALTDCVTDLPRNILQPRIEKQHLIK